MGSLTVDVEVHVVKEIALGDKGIGGLAHQTLSNMVHFGSETKDAHSSVAITRSLFFERRSKLNLE